MHIISLDFYINKKSLPPVKEAGFAFESNLCNEKSVLNKGIYSHTSPFED